MKCPHCGTTAGFGWSNRGRTMVRCDSCKHEGEPEAFGLVTHCQPWKEDEHRWHGDITPTEQALAKAGLS